jgi:hypothetical protein
MRVFEHPNMDGLKCPICKTNDDSPVVLIGIYGTQEGFNIEAAQFHVKCLELTWYRDEGLIIMQGVENAMVA